ncbi:hypothetical protein K488DRAFT_85009 [Vararia minispora EC-137]|uniref:Uncharacterized protein n=1 Tax=Vararia minispora EC-137 TaxID=1314806 RepID=A0ACB8QNS5_9AGAM|nr:hypothetical protein K488DRAFT_85009 [Vararia minispora EC-137]
MSSSRPDDFTIFALIPPSWTLLMIIMLLVVSTPRVEIVATFLGGVLWLIMGAWLADSLGSTTCTSLSNARQQTRNGFIPAERYCDIQKVQESFAWLLFILMLIWFFLIFNLTHRSIAMGREFIWREDINFLPWFGQVPSWPGYDEGQYPEQYRPFYGYPGTSGYYPGSAGGATYVQPQSGFATVLQGSQVSQVPIGAPMSMYHD